MHKQWNVLQYPLPPPFFFLFSTPRHFSQTLLPLDFGVTTVWSLDTCGELCIDSYECYLVIFPFFAFSLFMFMFIPPFSLLLCVSCDNILLLYVGSGLEFTS